MSETIFGSKRGKLYPSEKPAKKEKPRKKRSDAKHNIKFPLSISDKKDLEWKAFDHNMKITSFASMVVENELNETHSFQEFKYEEHGHLVNVWLSEDVFKDIRRIKLEMGFASYREVVFMLVKGYLSRVSPSNKKLNIRVYDGRNYHEI